VKVLAFRHVPFEDLGHIRPVLESRGIGVECVDLYRGSPVPDISQAAGLIFMGGPMSANDSLDYLRTEMHMIRVAQDRGQPLMGICLGSQLMARALGGRVYRNPEKEIGWFDIELSEEAPDDFLFRGLEPTLPVFHWHGETFSLPPDASLLASSKACRNQAYRIGRAAYGLQFHCEVTPEMIADWCAQDANCGDVRELSEPLDTTRNADSQMELSSHLFGQWASLL
jgi:GMP synthase-like glutamine amidotransferase